MSLLSHIHFEFLTTKQWVGGWIDGIVGRLGPTGRSITIRRQLWAVRKSVVDVLLITHSYANKAKSSEMWWDDNKLSGSWRRLKSSKMIGSGESKIYNQRRRKHMIWLMHNNNDRFLLIAYWADYRNYNFTMDFCCEVKKNCFRRHRVRVWRRGFCTIGCCRQH